MPQILEVLFEALTSAGIQWCLLRDDLSLEVPSGDIDMLVLPADLAQARRILQQQGFAPLPALGHASHTFFAGYDVSTDSWITLDVVSELAYGPHFSLRTTAAEGCLKRRQSRGTIHTLAPDDAFWTLLMHCLLDKMHWSPHRAAQLQQLASGARTDGPMAAIVRSHCPAGWTPESLIGSVRQGDWETLELLGPLFRKQWQRHQPTSQVRAIQRRMARRCERPYIVWRRRGFTVALLGPDGAGKSTLASGMQEAFYLPVQRVYMGLFQRTFSTRYPRITRVVVRFLMTWGRYILAQYHCMLGRLVIFDRYTFDALLSLDQPLSRRRRWYFWLLAHALPNPDLVIMLNADADIMLARKGEYDCEYLEAERVGFLRLQSRLPNMHVVNAGRSAQAVRCDVTDLVWRRYAIAHKGT